MEYTALLAGEPFSDRPDCVDPSLAAILRGANDTLSDRDRPELVPLLGRAIGLVVGPDVGEGPKRRLRRGGRSRRGGAAARTARLHALVAQKLRTAVPPTSSTAAGRHRRHAGVSETFWDLMDEPARSRTPREYSARLVQRVELLHRCYEDALAELGLARRTDRQPVPPRPVIHRAAPAELPR
jgi:hypothetical protein